MDQSMSATLLDDLCTLVGKPLPERAEIRVWGMSGVERVTFPDGTTAVFKYAKEPFDREAQALRMAHRRGLPVPALHATALRDKWLGMLMDDLGTPVRNADDLDGVAAAVILHAARPAGGLPLLDRAGLAVQPGRALDHLQRLRKADRWTDCDDIETALGKISAAAETRVAGATLDPFGWVHSEFHPTSVHIGEKRALGAIKPGEVQSWITSLTTTDKLAASTSRTVFNTVNAVFRAAVRDRMIPHNPCTDAKLPSVPRKKVVPLAVEQVRTLAEEIPGRYKGLVLLGACTGLRPGELFGLQLRHVDLLHATVSVEQQVHQTAQHGVYVCPPKTARSHRTVPLPRIAVDAMKAHLRDYPADGPESWIFTAPQGGPVVYTHFMDGSWRPACAKAGIPKGTGPHALRHHYASLLIKHGEFVKTVSERLGHTKAAMTLNIYTHLWPDSEERNRAAVDKAYADQSADAQPPVDEAA